MYLLFLGCISRLCSKHHASIRMQDNVCFVSSVCFETQVIYHIGKKFCFHCYRCVAPVSQEVIHLIFWTHEMETVLYSFIKKRCFTRYFNFSHKLNSLCFVRYHNFWAKLNSQLCLMWYSIFLHKLNTQLCLMRYYNSSLNLNSQLYHIKFFTC